MTNVGNFMSGENDRLFESSDRDMLRIFKLRYQSAAGRLPVTPCAHFTIGGVEIDEHCRTSQEGLFAACEVAYGVHGANRMGGNALTEALVFGYRAGSQAAAYSAGSKPTILGQLDLQHLLADWGNAAGKHLPSTALRSIRQTMWKNCGPVRNMHSLTLALGHIRNLEKEGIRYEGRQNLGLACSVMNSFHTATMIIKNAMERKESTGVHHIE